MSKSSWESRCKHPLVVRLYPKWRVHPCGTVPALRGRRVLGVLCHPDRTRHSLAGHGGQEQCGSRVAAAAAASSPASFGCPAGQRSLPAWLPLPEAFPLLLGEGGGSFFVSFPSPVCLQPGLPVPQPGALAPHRRGSSGVSRNGRVGQTWGLTWPG